MDLARCLDGLHLGQKPDMAVNPVIPVGIIPDPCNVAFTLQWETYEPVILFMQWTLTEPTYTPLHKRFRGVQYECGYITHWPRLECLRQREAGPTLHHTFVLPTLPPGTVVWFRMTTSCTLLKPIQYTPPLHLTIPECPTGPSFIKVTRTLNSTGSTTDSIFFQNVIAGSAALFNAPAGRTLINQSGHWQGYAYGRVRQLFSFPNTGTTWRIRFDGFTGAYQPAPEIVTLHDGGEYDFVLNFDYTHIQGTTEQITVVAEKIAGPDALIQFRGDSNSPLVLTEIFGNP